MKNKIIILAICSNLLLLNAQQINVSTYNIRNDNAGDVANGNGWKQRCPIVCNLIQFHDFDIFGSQEVLKSQLDDLLKAMPEYASIGVGRDDGKEKGEFEPVFYKKDKFKLIDTGDFWLSTITNKPNKGWDAALPRICTWGKFNMKENGMTFWLFNLHMDHIGVVARSESAKLVLERIKTMCGNDAVILMGDFNVDQHNEAYLLLNNSGKLKDIYDKATIKYALNGTFNAFNSNSMTHERIDHIFVSEHFKVCRYGILTDSYRSIIKEGDNSTEATLQNKYQVRMPSDHFPVMGRLKFSDK
jgi:endonuclease/exonuclease/phosphatase family metal-dependent hydrolase